MKNEPNKKRKAAVAVAVVLVLAALVVAGTVHTNSAEGNYHEIYRLLKKNQEHAPRMYNGEVLVTDKSGSEESTAMGAGTADYSGTNLQTEGIDEGDLVKTDGKYIYCMDSDYGVIDIYLANNGKPKKVSQIDIGKDYYGIEFNIYKKRLMLTAGESEAIACQTHIISYDISDVAKPEKLADIEQSGSLITTRMDQSCLYTVTRYYPISLENDKDPSQYIPKAGGKLISSKSIEVPNKSTALSFVVITGIDISNPDRMTDRKAILTSGDEFYMSKNNIYVIATDWTGPVGTNISKVAVTEGKLEIKETGRVKGYIDSSFSLDEYKGQLRVLTTLDTQSGSSYNNVYVLNEKMKVTGSIEKLAKDEIIYSARFMGNRGYFVTYRETDPLFAVDFSDPHEPKLTGKLKIPGFSDYLHAYDENTLLGLGFTGDSEQNKIKLSMYDISDPTDIKETDKTVLKNAYTAEGTYNHHAVLVSAEKGIVGFSAGNDKKNTYYLYKYDKNKGFSLSKTFDLGKSEIGIRGIYIGDWFYLVQQEKIEAEKL